MCHGSFTLDTDVDILFIERVDKMVLTEFFLV